MGSDLAMNPLPEPGTGKPPKRDPIKPRDPAPADQTSAQEWTRDRPTRSGYYWIADFRAGFARVDMVFYWGDGLYWLCHYTQRSDGSHGFGRTLTEVDMVGVLWCGPIVYTLPTPPLCECCGQPILNPKA